MPTKLTQAEIEKALGDLPKAGDLSLIKGSIRSQLLDGIRHIHPRPAIHPLAGGLKWAPMALASLLIISSGTAVLADSAKPGDLLYPIDTFTEQISASLIKDQSVKAKFYAATSEERVSELDAMDARDLSQLTAERKARAESLREMARSRAAIGFEQLNQVQAVILEKYSSTDNAKQKDAYLKLSKQLQQVIDRKAARAKTLHDILDGKRSPDEDFRLDDDSRQAIRIRIRQEFKVGDQPLDYQFYDPALPPELTPPLRDGDKDGIPDREDPWVPRPLEDDEPESEDHSGQSSGTPLFPL